VDSGLVTAVLGARGVAGKDGAFLGFSMGATAADTSVVGFERAAGLVDWGFGEARAKEGRVGAGVTLPAMIEVAKTDSLRRMRSPIQESNVAGMREKCGLIQDNILVWFCSVNREDVAKMSQTSHRKVLESE
jgi:hypothetical protein